MHIRHTKQRKPDEKQITINRCTETLHNYASNTIREDWKFVTAFVKTLGNLICRRDSLCLKLIDISEYTLKIYSFALKKNF